MTKHLTTLLALLLSCSMLGQNFPVPYNPDDDANGLIGTPDLLSLLALFGEEFSAAVVAENNESAILYVGELAYPLCAQSCRNLPGMWELSTLEDLGLVWDEVHPFASTSTWLRPNQMTNTSDNQVMEYVYSPENGNAQFGTSQVISTARRCYCSIKEIPKVEYSFCRPTTNISEEARIEFSDCCSDKTQNGWFPIPGSTTGVSGNEYAEGNTYGQAFWRWAE